MTVEAGLGNAHDRLVEDRTETFFALAEGILRPLALCEVLDNAVAIPDPAVSSAYCPGAFANE